MGPRAHPLLLLILCAVLLFLGLGTLGLTDRDEGSNGEAGREMVQSGDLITPTLNGTPRFAKPIFIYWLIAGAYRVVGVSEFAARLPSAVFGTGLILMQYYFARRFLGPVTAFRAAVILLLNFEMLAIGRMVLTDMVLVFFTTLSIFSFFLGLWGEGREKRWYWVFYVALALGTLTKGPVGFLVPLLAIIPYLILIRPWRYGRPVLKECHPIAGALLFLALAAPWYATMLSLHGSGYLASARGDTVKRFFSVIGGHGGTILFYVPVLLVGFFPWSGFLPAAIVGSLREMRQRERAASREKAAVLADAGREGETYPPGVGAYENMPPTPAQVLAVLCALWVLSVFVFFTVSSTRLPHYIAPLFPAAALLVAMWWDRLHEESTAGKFSFWLTLFVGACLGLAFIGMNWAYERFTPVIAKEFPAAAGIDPGWVLMTIGFILLIGIGAWGYVWMEGRPVLSFATASTLMVAVAFLIITVALPRFNQYFIAPPQELAAIAGLNLDANDTLIAYGRSKPSLLFYAKRDCATKPCIEVITPGEEARMLPLLERPGQIMILTQERLRTQLPSSVSNYRIALTRHGYVLLAKNPTF
jgi:4-amino-4-deoxy-L-arabinose transferase-like glycosyltransferase